MEYEKHFIADVYSKSDYPYCFYYKILFLKFLLNFLSTKQNVLNFMWLLFQSLILNFFIKGIHLTNLITNKLNKCLHRYFFNFCLKF